MHTLTLLLLYSLTLAQSDSGGGMDPNGTPNAGLRIDDNG